MSDKIIERLADYASSIEYDALPSDVIHQVKRLIVDSLGCGIGAFDSYPVKAIRRLATQYRAKKSATLLGTGLKTTPELAALANGTMVRYLDFNDNYAGKSNAHPSDNIPVVLAAAEAYNASGRDLITGIVLAYEVQTAWADTFRLRDGGPWDQAVYATISMPLGAGKVIGLSRKQLAEAIRISVVQGLPLLEARRGTISHWKACAVPNAGRNGVFSAMLAEQGLTGPPDIFDGEAGFFAGATRGPVTLQPLAGEEDNEQPFRIMKSSIKHFPAGFYSQTAIKGALEARKALGIRDSRAIKRIVVRTFENGFKVMAGDKTRWHPKTRETADHSIPYVVACAIHFGSLGIDHFENEILENPELKKLMGKIEVLLDARCEEEWPEAILNKVKVETMDGRIYDSENSYYHGHFKQPMEDDDIEKKFSDLTNNFLSYEQQVNALETLWNLENTEVLSDVLEYLVI